MIRSLILLATLSILLAGCGGQSSLKQEKLPPPIPYERVWVDPQVVYADSLLTLVHAYRVDSIPADLTESPEYESPKVEFEVTEFSCPVAVDLLDANQNALYPLLRQDLSAGYYRLTFEPRRYIATPLLPGVYFLSARACGVKSQTSFPFQ